MRDSEEHHLEADDEVLEPLGICVCRKERRGVNVAKVNQRGDEAALPEREEDHQLDAEKLGERLDGRQVVISRVVKESQGVDGQHLREVGHGDHVKVGSIQAPLAIAVHTKHRGEQDDPHVDDLPNDVLERAELALEQELVAHLPCSEHEAHWEDVVLLRLALKVRGKHFLGGSEIAHEKVCEVPNHKRLVQAAHRLEKNVIVLVGQADPTRN
mmetsp:Transcript_6010/g.16843  ORF Transcript_6010/g.16843 Transcript_6010/m.16843 type:complete len:213 (+) Transcript_6010:696-1334(+)